MTTPMKLISFTRSTKDGLMQWFENEKGEEVDVTPRKCEKCGEGMWSGHVVEVGEYTYLCETCMDELYDADERERMYDEDEQYWTQWDECEIEEQGYEIEHIELPIQLYFKCADGEAVDDKGSLYYPRHCADCNTGLWEGYVSERLEKCYCETCGVNRIEAGELNPAREDEYYASFEHTDFDEQKYEVTEVC